MNSKYLFTGIALIIVAVVVIMMMNQTNAPAEVANQNSAMQNANTENEVSNTNTTPANLDDLKGPQTQEVVEDPNEPDGNDVAVFEVVYDGKVFNPSDLNIKTGDVVIFKNEGTASFWPASGPHPTHTSYPEFDAKKAVGPGQQWQFKFTKAGSWPFHDHLNSSAIGKITVD